jgi:hypothetical protein
MPWLGFVYLKIANIDLFASSSQLSHKTCNRRQPANEPGFVMSNTWNSIALAEALLTPCPRFWQPS